jgi:hypothetical protein
MYGKNNKTHAQNVQERHSGKKKSCRTSISRKGFAKLQILPFMGPIYTEISQLILGDPMMTLLGRP